ncbi:MAG: permease [Myxococcales bacterium]|nr:permease [Myxococcales bacterium]
MSGVAYLCTSILLVALAAQARWPSARLAIVTGGAGVTCLVTSLSGVASTSALLGAVPWDVLVMLIALGLLSELLVESRLFGALALASTRRSGADPRRLLLLFSVGMYLVSGLVNNLTAILFVLPILLRLFKLLGVTQRYLAWSLGVLLVACNLGGAATPIGDFPAILLLGGGRMGFTDYLVAAAPPTALALVLLLAVTILVVRPTRDLDDSPLRRRLAVAVIGALYRRVTLDRRRLVPAVVAITAMIVAWVTVPPTRVGPELICWLGVGVALATWPRVGERLLRTRIEMDGALFLLSLFVMVGGVSRAGTFVVLARWLTDLPVSPLAQLTLFLLFAGVLTGLFSAGPSMAALLEVADVLAARMSPTAVYVGLALSVCAGSSLFLTAATSGPMAQIMTEKARLSDPGGRRLQFGFFQFAPIGLVAFTIIQAVAVAYAVTVAST